MHVRLGSVRLRQAECEDQYNENLLAEQQGHRPDRPYRQQENDGIGDCVEHSNDCQEDSDVYTCSWKVWVPNSLSRGTLRITFLG